MDIIREELAKTGIELPISEDNNKAKEKAQAANVPTKLYDYYFSFVIIIVLMFYYFVIGETYHCLPIQALRMEGNGVL